jgi:hypothetical protein
MEPMLKKRKTKIGQKLSNKIITKKEQLQVYRGIYGNIQGNKKYKLTK